MRRATLTIALSLIAACDASDDAADATFACPELATYLEDEAVAEGERSFVAVPERDVPRGDVPRAAAAELAAVSDVAQDTTFATGGIDFDGDEDRYVVDVVDADEAGADTFRPAVWTTFVGDGAGEVCAGFGAVRFTAATCRVTPLDPTDAALLRAEVRDDGATCCIVRDPGPSGYGALGRLELDVASAADDGGAIELRVRGDACARQDLSITAFRDDG
jgi:hypothetical protein